MPSANPKCRPYGEGFPHVALGNSGGHGDTKAPSAYTTNEGLERLSADPSQRYLRLRAGTETLRKLSTPISQLSSRLAAPLKYLER